MGLLAKFIDKRIAAYQQSLVATHYAEVENMHKQMRGWRHDYHTHIQALKALAAEEDVPAIRHYLNDLETDLGRLDAVIKTGNPMADAILSSKISLARSKDIAVMADANIPALLTTGAVDLCIIIGNLMDNAIDACMALAKEDRLIRVYMEMKNTQLYISITNTAPAGRRYKAGRRHATTKGEGHGFGLARIDHIVDRYSGYLSRNSEDGVYSTEILLPQ
ncbi:MAG: ATP-binding protein [Defluviitaleaceae bacterium]|nr:ATP-binding protein [Defluviitaleaceae bacterium]